MKLIKQNVKVRCDMPMCKNIADYTLIAEEKVSKSNINICKDCMEKLYEAIGHELVPKSPENIIKKHRQRASE